MRKIKNKSVNNISIINRAVTWLLILSQVAFSLVTLPTLASVELFDSSESSLAAERTSLLASSVADNGTRGLKTAASNIAVGAVSSTAEGWLQHFGTAQINLNVDDNGSWESSSFDFLEPLYDNKTSIFYTQLGLRAPDGHTTGNIGMGVRTFNTLYWMFGANAFLDNDFTGKNRRIGIGTEAWTDYLKLAANSYIGTTEWHNTGDLPGYNEKPANGFDVRAEGFLPSYPQLGTKLIYEQYYGDNVALFDKDHLQSNPSAVTVGLNYTPVPLVTVGVDYKHGQSSMDEMKFSLNFRYALGQSWQSQLSPEQVAIRRSLAGSRYDLVDRNNEIVLQYKKSDKDAVLADMTLTPVKDGSPADGATANTVALHAITSDHKPVANTVITWSVGGGAKLSSTTSVTDSYGNTSVNITNTTAEQITVTATAGTLTRSTQTSFSLSVAALNLVMTKDGSEANSIDQNSAQVTLKDANENILSGIPVTWQSGRNTSITSSDSVTNSDGVAAIHFSSGIAGTEKLSVSAGSKSASIDSTFVAESIATITATMTTNHAPADGSATNVARATVTDAGGQPMPNVSVTWTLTGSATASTPTTVSTDASGIATLALTDAQSEVVTATASAGGHSCSTTATFDPVQSSAVAATMTTNHAPANGSATNVARAMVTDAGGQPMPNVSVTWTLTGSAAASTPTTVSTDASGIATLAFTDAQSEVVTVIASAGGHSGSTTATFDPVPVSTVAVTMTINHAPADGSATNVARATVTDAGGQPMPNVSVSWTLTGSATASTPTTVSTDASGIATLALTDAQPEVVTATASAGGHSGSTTATFDPVLAGDVALSVMANNAVANGTAANTVQAVVTDSTGKPIPNTDVTWSISGSSTAHLSTAAVIKTNTNGIATVSLVDTVAETVTVNASADGLTSSTVTSFIADAATARVTSLVININNSTANGTSQNRATATVADANGNAVANSTVNWSADGGAILTAETSQTDENGQAVMTLTDTHTVEVDLSASVGNTAPVVKATTFTFIVDHLTMDIVVEGHGGPSSPTKNIIRMTAFDSNGQPMPGVNMALRDNDVGIAVGFDPSNGTTDATGSLTSNVISSSIGLQLLVAETSNSQGTQKTATASVIFSNQ